MKNNSAQQQAANAATDAPVGHTIEGYLRQHLRSGLKCHNLVADADANGNLRLTVKPWHGGWMQLTFVVTGNELTLEKRVKAGDLDVPAFLKFQAE